jgi:hypothetical protein
MLGLPELESLEEYQAISTPAETRSSKEESVANAAFHALKTELEDHRDSSPLDIIDRSDFSPSDDTNVEGERVFYADDTFHICSAYPGPENLEKGWQSGLKGHEHRNLAVYHETGFVPPSDEFYSDLVDKSAAEVLRDITASQIEDGYLAIFGSMA